MEEIMAEDFKITTSMTKKELIEKYSKLFNAYQKKLKEAGEALKWRSEAEKLKEKQAVESAKKATVEGVLEGVTSLRTLLGKTLYDLTQKLSSQAEKLEDLNQAIAVQEERLKELYDIEPATESFRKLMAAYEEQKLQIEEEIAQRIKELEDGFSQKTQELTSGFETSKAVLEKEIAEETSEWEKKKAALKQEFEEFKKKILRDRQREEEEYLYERDKKRKLEEDAYNEKARALEKELEDKKTKVLKEIEQREAAVLERENELADLKQQVETFPALLEKEIQKAKKEAEKSFKQELEQSLFLAKKEAEWEGKIYEQKAQFLEDTIKGLKKKIEDLETEAAKSVDQVAKIAEKAIEGASQFKAFSSVKEIAMEQARKTGTSEQDRQ